MDEEIEELDDEDVDVETNVSYDLIWTCPRCKYENVEYDILPETTVQCVCEQCQHEYEYFYEPY